MKRLEIKNDTKIADTKRILETKPWKRPEEYLKMLKKRPVSRFSLTVVEVHRMWKNLIRICEKKGLEYF